MSLLRVVLLCLSVASTVAAEDPCLAVAHAEENCALALALLAHSPLTAPHAHPM
jgi:hypothetical protein|tara:strand:- start:63 stop:224 length:162 start_codon:yes stop_codon:yes gene_type:complete